MQLKTFISGQGQELASYNLLFRGYRTSKYFIICDWICKNSLLAQQLKSILWLNIKATLSHYPGSPSTWV